MTTVWTQETDARLRDYLASQELAAAFDTARDAAWGRYDPVELLERLVEGEE